MSRTALNHVTDWIFDLDNTLYPRGYNLFAQIDVLITQYVMDITGLPHDEARQMQKAYYLKYGTTLKGLMAEHDIDPEHYLKTRARDRLFLCALPSRAGGRDRGLAGPQVHLHQCRHRPCRGRA